MLLTKTSTSRCLGIAFSFAALALPMLVSCGSVNTVSTRTDKATTSIPFHTQVNDAL